jgi:hypothetical protein
LILEDAGQVRRFIEAMRMKEIRNKMREEMHDAKSTVDISQATAMLRQERCIIEFSPAVGSQSGASEEN